MRATLVDQRTDSITIDGAVYRHGDVFTVTRKQFNRIQEAFPRILLAEVDDDSADEAPSDDPVQED